MVFVHVYERRLLRKYDLPYDLVKQGNHCTLDFIVFPILIVLIVRTPYCFFGHSFCLHYLIVPSVDILLLPL